MIHAARLPSVWMALFKGIKRKAALHRGVLKGMKELVFTSLQQLTSHHDEIECRYREDIPFSLQIILRSLSVAEGQRRVFR